MTMAVPELPQQGGGRGPGIPDPPSHTHLQSWLIQLPSLLSFWPTYKILTSASPLRALKVPGPGEGTVLSWCQMRAIWLAKKTKHLEKIPRPQ